MHVVKYHKQKFELPNPLNTSKYVGITDDVETAWKDVAYRKLLIPTLFCQHRGNIPTSNVQSRQPDTVGLDKAHLILLPYSLERAGHP